MLRNILLCRETDQLWINSKTLHGFHAHQGLFVLRWGGVGKEGREGN